MKAKKKWTIAIRPKPDERPRKITKIIGLNGDGFSILAPYHKERSGVACKLPVDAKIAGEPGTYHIPWTDTIAFTAEDQVKLSYHPDGFAQFSSVSAGKIISGRDPNTGEPKGLGLFTHTFDQPIFSGPAVGLTVWGIHDFEEADENDETLLFEPHQFYYRDCGPDDAHGWVLSIYTYSSVIQPPVQFENGHCIVSVTSDGINGPIRSIVKHSLVYLPNELVFLGLMVNCTKTEFPSNSGWSLHGPGNYTAWQRGHVLMAMYPRPAISMTDRPSLDRDPPNNPT